MNIDRWTGVAEPEDSDNGSDAYTSPLTDVEIEKIRELDAMNAQREQHVYARVWIDVDTTELARVAGERHGISTARAFEICDGIAKWHAVGTIEMLLHMANGCTIDELRELALAADYGARWKPSVVEVDGKPWNIADHYVMRREGTS